MLILGVALTYVQKAPSAHAQSAPDVVWQAVSTNTLANSIEGVGWSPTVSDNVAFGSTDRWLRTRQANDGSLVYSVLQPLRSGSADQTLYSTDATFLAVHNSGAGPGYRVHRAADGIFLGTLTVTVDANGLVRFAPDSQLLATVGGDGTLSRWQLQSFTVSIPTGSGYNLVDRTFNFSPDGLLQSTASQGTLTLRRRTTGQTVRQLKAGLAEGLTPTAFTPDSSRIAAAGENPSKVTLWRISDGVKVRDFVGSATNDGITAIGFSPDGTHLVTTGYLSFVDAGGLLQQKGVIRFWRISDGSLSQVYDARTGTALTSPVAWSADGTRFAYGTYEGTAVVARTPSTILPLKVSSLQIRPDGNVLLRQSGTPGAEYHVEATTNLLVWREVGISTANSDGYYEFVDTNGHGSPLKLYRFWTLR